MGARPADYRPYMVMEPGPDSRGLTVAEELAKWQAYLAAMRRNATYGDELTLRAASRVLRCDIWVLNATSREALRGCRQPSPTATIVLTYRPEHYDTVILPLPSQRLLEATTGDTVPLARLALINAGPVAGTDAPTHHLPTGVPAAARTRQRNTRPRAPEPRLPSIAEAKQDRSWSPHDDDIVIVTINVTSLDTEKLLVVALLKADIVVLQETRVTKAEKAYMGSFLAAYGWNVHWGDDVTMWTHKMQEAWAHGRGLVFNFIADKYASPLTFLRRDDGTLTANAAEIDEILRGEKAWGGIFQRYTTREEPCWGRFLRMYSPVLPDRAEMECEAITVGDVKAALAKMKKSASAGMHGWRIHELQQLPNSLLEGFARVLNEVEESGEWPEELMHALVSLIPKPKSTGDPLSQRPISVAPVLYRIWAAVRAKDAQRWMDELAPEGLHGCRPKHSTEDLFWHLAAEIEEAHLMGRPLYGIAFDFKKCFDSVPINVTLQLAKKLGFNRKQWKHGGELWNAMHWWLNRLRWAHVGSEHAVTFLELAIDFEVTTGVRLPIVANRRIQPPAASKAKATSARAVLPPRETTEGLCMYFDGGSRQNGTALAVAGAGAVIYKDGLKLAETTVPLGRTTNNVAEYNGLIAGIRLLGEQPGDVEGPVKVRGDSQVVIGPVNGTAMCKPNLRPYFLQARASMADLTPRFEFSLEHVPRSRNVDADALSNAAMDRVQAETGAQVGLIRAQYEEYKGSALAKGRLYGASPDERSCQRRQKASS
ncbi:Ribonuclease HI [Diplonema papillatum]|nr:Ribonuclease HI [Diplonema papillatum]